MKVQAWIEDRKGRLVAFSSRETERELRLSDEDWDALADAIDDKAEDIDHGFRVRVAGYVAV